MKPKLDNIKMIFLDIDGTLYNSKKQVTEYTKKILNKVIEKGIYVVLCSGRSNWSVIKVSKDVNESKYVISCNGAFVYNYKDDIDIFESIMKKESLEKIWKFCEKESIKLILEAKEQRYVNFESDERNHIKIDGIEDISDKKIYQVIIDNVEIEKTEKVKELLASYDSVWSPNYGPSDLGDYFFDINTKSIDKGIGISNLIKYLGIKKEDTIGFGDGINDYAMFRECGIGVAMGNADEELKRRANYITLTNDEDVIAKFIEKYILESLVDE